MKKVLLVSALLFACVSCVTDDSTPLVDDQGNLIGEDLGEWSGAIASGPGGTRNDLVVSCYKPTLLGPIAFLFCSCNHLVKSCSDATCGNCDGANEKTIYCGGYDSWIPRLPNFSGSCSTAQATDCSTYCQQACPSSCK